MSEVNQEVEVNNEVVDTNKLLDSQFDEILAKLDTPEYKERGYAPGATVTIPASLFVDFNSFVGQVSEILKGIAKSADSQSRVANHYTDEAYKFAVRFASAHVKNIEDGNTVPNSELDKSDAEVKIQETKVAKKKK